MSRQGGTWRIGELARESGLTVRTLHHYDQLGLLSPLSRTERGHRCYTSGDVRRLHRIVALRSLGISLEEIGMVLDGEPDPVGLLRRQLDVVEDRIRNAISLRTQLLDVLDSLGRNAEPSARQLLQLIEETVAMNEPMTPEQFAQLKEERERQARELSDEDFAALRQKMKDTWNALSRQEQQRLTEQRRKMIPHSATLNEPSPGMGRSEGSAPSVLRLGSLPRCHARPVLPLYHFAAENAGTVPDLPTSRAVRALVERPREQLRADFSRPPAPAVACPGMGAEADPVGDRQDYSGEEKTHHVAHRRCRQQDDGGEQEPETLAHYH
jgi:MerR family transcriptional regulator, thiopeptide resistance regulator